MPGMKTVMLAISKKRLFSGFYGGRSNIGIKGKGNNCKARILVGGFVLVLSLPILFSGSSTEPTTNHILLPTLLQQPAPTNLLDSSVPVTEDNAGFLLRGTYAHLTNGVFLHLGKTGGSTISALLANGCHSWMPKPCHPDRVPHETVVSQKIQAYFHTPDFLKLPQSPNDSFYFLTLRDPYERTRSAFVYQHPANGKLFKNHMHYLDDLRKQHNFSRPALIKCYDTLEHFVQHLGNGDDARQYTYPAIPYVEPRQSYVFSDWESFFANARDELVNGAQTGSVHPQPIFELHQDNCQEFCRAALDHQVPALEHFYYNYKHLQELLLSPTVGPNANNLPHVTNTTILFVARTEHLQQDWIRTNLLLDSKKNTSAASIPFPATKRRQIGHKFKLRVTNELSERGRAELCKALRSEYETYVWFLRRAVNLRPANVEESLAVGRKNCPELEFQ